MFTDPQAIVIAGNTYTLPRIYSSANQGKFLLDSTLGTLTLGITQNQTGKNTRSSARLSVAKAVPSPLIDGNNIPVEWSATLVLERPTAYVSGEATIPSAQGLLTWLTASSYAQLVKLAGLEI